MGGKEGRGEASLGHRVEHCSQMPTHPLLTSWTHCPNLALCRLGGMVETCPIPQGGHGRRGGAPTSGWAGELFTKAIEGRE